MSPTIQMLVFAIITLSPIIAATVLAHGEVSEGPRSCATSCIVTVTTTVTALSPCSATSSVIPTSLTNATSTTSHGHHTYQHHQNSTIASWAMNATTTSNSSSAAGMTGTANLTITVDPTSVAEPTNSSNSIHRLRHQHITSSQVLVPKISKLLLMSTSVLPGSCHHNNCFRQFIRHPEVTGFCATYTTDIETTTTGLPDYVSQCHSEPSRISSACSCIASGLSPTSLTAAGATASDDGSYATATASSTTAQTSIHTISNDCPAASIVFETWTTTINFVKPVTLDQASAIAASTIPSVTDFMTTFTISGASWGVSTTSRVREHGHRHGGQ